MFRIIAVPVVPTSLKSLLDVDRDYMDNGVALQAPVANADVVNFGDSVSQPGFVPAGGSTDVLPLHRLSSLYLVGTVGDNVIVMIF